MMDVQDDTLALSFQTCQQKQDKTMMLTDKTSQVPESININQGKAKRFKAISAGKEPVTFEGKALGEVVSCACLGSTIKKESSADTKDRPRISQVQKHVEHHSLCASTGKYAWKPVAHGMEGKDEEG